MQSLHRNHWGIFLVLFGSFFYTTARAEGVIGTIAGTVYKFPATPINAAQAPLGTIQSIAVDPSGNLFIADDSNHMVFKVTPSAASLQGGVLTIVAGNGSFGYAADGAAAIAVSLGAITGVAADGAGNVYIAEGATAGGGGNRVLIVTPDGKISVYAGCGDAGYGGDGGPATRAWINNVHGLFADGQGNLYIADSGNNRIRKVDSRGIIRTVAGNGTCCFEGDAVPATSTPLNNPSGVFLDDSGRMYIADTDNDRIRRVGTDGSITTIAGSQRGYGGDGGAATQAKLHSPTAAIADPQGNVFIADMSNQRVRRVSPEGIIETVAGNGQAAFVEDPDHPLNSSFRNPLGIAISLGGGLFIADSGNSRVRLLTPSLRPADPSRSRALLTYAGNNNFMFSGEGVQAVQAVFNGASRVAFDESGSMFITDTSNNRVRRVAPNGVITTVAGRGPQGSSGDGGPATDALLNRPVGLAVDEAGNIYIAETTRIRKVDLNGVISTFAGRGGSCASGNGDGGPALKACFSFISDIDLDRAGNMYVADALGSRVRRISPDGTVDTVSVFTGFPMAVTPGPDGSIYISLQALSLARRDGGVIRIAPDGTRSIAVQAMINPGKPAIDLQSAVYVTDHCYGLVPGCENTVIKVVEGNKSIFAGTGEQGYSGDGGPAAAAMLDTPGAVRFDPAGNLCILDSGNNRIRKVYTNPISGLPEPSLSIHLKPGFYIASLTTGDGEHDGNWGMEILAPTGVLAGGLNFGGVVQAQGLPPAFAAVFLPTRQTVRVKLDAQVIPGGDPVKLGLVIRTFDAQRQQVGDAHQGTTSILFEQTLGQGFYIFDVNGIPDSPRATFQISANSDYFSGGADAGGFLAAGLVGFAALYTTEEQDIHIQAFGQPSYGGDGAGAMVLRIYDEQRRLLRTIP